MVLSVEICMPIYQYIKCVGLWFSTIFLHPFLHPNGMKVYDFV
nr:MAG TPA: hypothetical protein [Inoviridae sp.]